MTAWTKWTALLVIAALALPGCSLLPSDSSRGSEKRLPKPGLERQADGMAEARGWLVHRDLEGGFWALVDVKPGSAGSSKVIVVMLPGKLSEAGIAKLDGAFVRATGRMADGVSTRMSGPEMKVDAIEVLSSNKP